MSGADSPSHHHGMHGMMNAPRMKDKVAIVTGSSSGIGKAIALRLGQEGATVIVAARRFQTDVADERQVERLMADTVERYGRIDVLINNAGIGGGTHLAETSTQSFDDVMSVNLRDVLLLPGKPGQALEPTARRSTALWR